jgi:phosphotriesterase-related protein
MTTVQSVQGPIAADDLGTVLVHEHVRFRDEAVADQWPGHYDAQGELDAAVEMVKAALPHGLSTIVDPTAMFGGRDVRFMRRVAEETGVRIIPCTGIYTYDYLPHYFMSRSPDQIAEHFVEDIERGIQGTDIRAQFLKCAADAQGVTENVEKVHRACARASVQTGVPIMAHSHPASGTGPKQVAIFQEEGVDMERVQIAHCGDTTDVDYIAGLIDQGVYVGLDRYGIEMYLPFEQRQQTTIELIRRGLTDKLHLSADACATIDWFPPEIQEALMGQGAVKDWNFSIVFERVLPGLREAGVVDDAVERTLMVDNPRRWLAGA